MSDHAGQQFLVRIEDGQQLGPIPGSKGDLTFPEEVRGWGDVVDCRHAPYLENNLDELLHLGGSIHKRYILVFEDKLQKDVVATPQED